MWHLLKPVPIPNITDHLVFIFALLTWVKSVAAGWINSTEIPSDLRVFLARALYRLELWLTLVVGERGEHRGLRPEKLPPLDVAILLHAFFLSPHRFVEDGFLRLPQLFTIGQFPLKQLVISIQNFITFKAS